MIIIYGMVFLFYIVLLCLARKRGMEISKYFYEMGRRKGMFGQRGIRENISLLQPDSGGRAEREGEYVKQFYIGKIKLFLQMLLLGNLLAVCLWLAGSMVDIVEEGKYIRRNAYGQGSMETKLQAEIEGEEGAAACQDFTFWIEERQYETVLVKQMARELAQELPRRILGSNVSLEEVREDLNLCKEAEGYPFRIEWESDDYAYVSSDGTVTNDELREEGAVVCLTAVFLYGDYKEEHIFPVHIFPPQYSEEERLRRKIYELLEDKEGENRYGLQVELPENIEGKQLFWSERREDSSGMLFLLTGIAAVAVYLLKNRDLRERVEERNRQMLLDYPQLVSRITLYMGAGMTVRNVFCKIALDYQKERQAGGKMHYVYEEMLLACYELNNGVSEAAAYEHFGRRCRLIQYMKFTNLLVQNLKKGSNGILEALHREARDAFEERRNLARKLGEEAGTKLLLPMMLMLGIVMVLIIAPAYFSFSA